MKLIMRCDKIKFMDTGELLKKIEKIINRVSKCTSAELAINCMLDEILEVCGKTECVLLIKKRGSTWHQQEEEVFIPYILRGKFKEKLSISPLLELKFSRKMFQRIISNSELNLLNVDLNNHSVKPYLEKFDIEFCEFFPLISDGEIRGLLHIEMGEEVISVLRIIGYYLAILLENLTLSENALYRINRLSTLYEISKKSQTYVRPGEALRAVSDILSALIDFDICALYLCDNNKLILEKFKAKPNFRNPYPDVIDFGETELGNVARNRKPLLFHFEEYKSCLALPVFREKFIGILFIGTIRSFAYTEADIISINILASHLTAIDAMTSALISIRTVTENILESMTHGMIVLDFKGNITKANKVARSYFVELSEKVATHNYKEVFAARPALIKVIEQTLREGRIFEDHSFCVNINGTENILEVNSFLTYDDTGAINGAALFFKDVTKIKQLESHLRRTEQLTALGRMATGVAHEIRNPLSGIKMVIQILISETEETDSRYEYLEVILNEVNRLEGIIAQLMDFARPITPELQEVDIEKILRTVVLLLKEQAIEKKVSFYMQPSFEVLKVFADSQQLKQVFLNILKNAIEASKPLSTISIDYFDNEEMLEIGIANSGKPIAEENLKLIFNPFFTTKDTGTGLGLSVAHKIVESHKGYIRVENQDDGVRFVVGLRRCL